MAGQVEKKLEELGVVLHTPAAPVANYVGVVRTGTLLFVSGQEPAESQFESVIDIIRRIQSNAFSSAAYHPVGKDDVSVATLQQKSFVKIGIQILCLQPPASF